MLLIITSEFMYFDDIEIFLTDKEKDKVISGYNVSSVNRCHHCDHKMTNYFLCILGNINFRDQSYLVSTIRRSDIPIYTLNSKLYLLCSKRCFSERVSDIQISNIKK